MDAVHTALDVDPGFDLEELRRHRAELRESMHAVEQALAAPAPGRAGAWAERVHVALVELSSDFRQHVGITEGPDGLYQDVLATAPRLSNPVARLTREHEEIGQSLDDAVISARDAAREGGVDRVRDMGVRLLGRLVRHRQGGSDLLYEAFESDLGGQD